MFMTRPSISLGAPSPRALLFFGLCSTLAVGCSSDDDSSSPPPPPPPSTATAFSSTLDRAQTTNNATQGTLLRITVKNEAPTMGTFQTPVWVGLHDGTFDTYDLGSAASAELERLAEDGNVADLQTAFDTAAVGAGSGTINGVLQGAELAPGESASITIRVDPTDPNARYFSYASMVIPSNDAFIANGDPTAHEIFDATGTFLGASFTVLGTDVLDAGTEVNDELPANTAFFGQAAPNTGMTEGANITDHPGFIPASMGGMAILDDPMFVNADFENTVGYEMLSVEVTEVTEIAEPTGAAHITLDEATMMIDVNVVAANLSGDATMIHIHEGAAGTAGGVAVDLGPFITRNENGNLVVSGTTAVTMGQIEALRNDELYINIHTDLNAAGEIRGQLDDSDVATAALDTASNVTATIAGSNLRVTVQNRAPETGTFQTPMWFGLHDGTFDIYDSGAAASAELERLAEDGTIDPLATAFGAAMGTATGGTVMGSAGPIAPGETATATIRIDETNANSRYFSWATMIIPSNDAFIANADPMAHEVFDAGGAFNGVDFVVDATAANDAGTEMNDEIPMNTAFFGQTTPNTGTAEMANIGAHPGYLDPLAMPAGILADPMFAGADFANVPGYEFISVNFGTSANTTPNAEGLVFVDVDGAASTLTVSAINLSGPARSVTLRNAAAGVDGPVLFDLSSAIENGEGGSMTLSDTFAADAAFEMALAAGEVYVEVTTDLNPTGELRGQLSEAP